MRNEVIFDSRGIPDILVVFTPDELGLPAEIKGRAVKEYAISKYPNTMIEGVPYSLPYQQPAVNVNHDEAIRLCESKGPGWHLITNDEWAALAHQSRKNGTLPRGNTDCGKSHSHPEETGTTYRDSSGDSKTLTGSGPVTWNHDHTAEGVADMCGNIFEHVGGIRFLNGQVQVIPNNEAAAGADQSKDSKEWTPIHTADGGKVHYNIEDGRIELRAVALDGKDYDGVEFKELDGSAIDIPEQLIELGLYPAPGYEGKDYFWLDTDGERIVFRGGYWYAGAAAGVFSFNGLRSRARVSWTVGFRSALIRYSGDSGDLDNLEGEATDLSNAPQKIKDEIKANADKLSRRDKGTSLSEATHDWPFPLPDTLPDMVKYALAIQLTEIYKAAGREDILEFTSAAYNSTDEELSQTIKTAQQLAQLNISVEAMKRGMGLAKLATTLTLTIGKEAADHE